MAATSAPASASSRRPPPPSLCFLGVHPRSTDHYYFVPSEDGSLSCGQLIIVLWVFVFSILAVIVYCPHEFHPGPYTSMLLQPNAFFVQSLKVESLNEPKVPPVLYGFDEVPELNITKIWSQNVCGSLKPVSNMVWMHFMNKGSQMNISYNVPTSSSLVLIIAEGIEEMVDWSVDPLNSNATMSWNVMNGNGSITLDISKSSEYYVAVANRQNADIVEVKLSLSVRSYMYDTTHPYFKCDLAGGSSCELNIPFFGSSHAAVLTTPGPQQCGNKFHLKVSYDPRWSTYFLGIGVIGLMMLVRKSKELIKSYGNITIKSKGMKPEADPLLGDGDLSKLEDGLGVEGIGKKK